MNPTKIFVFWLGDQKQKELIIEKFKKLESLANIKIIFGPTDEEHEYLMKNFKYYRKKFLDKKYAFLSDTWRFYKLSKEDGIYIDALSNINYERFINYFLKKYNEEGNIFIKENGHLIWNGIIASSNKQLFEKILNYQKNHWKICSKLTGPLLLSIFVYKFYGVKLNKSIFIDAREIDPFSNSSTFNYNGLGSWGYKNKKEIDFDNREKTGAHQYFHKNALKFEKGFSKFWIIIRWLIKHYLIIYLLPSLFRNNK